MAPKSRKSISAWFECETCHVVLTQKDLSTHSEKSCPPSTTTWEHGFIKEQVLFGILEELKPKDGICNVPERERGKMVFLSQPAMQLCGICLGNPVVVTCQGMVTVKTAWPMQEKSLVSVLMAREALECFRAQLPGPVKVERLIAVPLPAQEVVIHPTNPIQVSATLLMLVRRHHQGAIVCTGNKLFVPYYGKTIMFNIQSISPFLTTDHTHSSVISDDVKSITVNIDNMAIGDMNRKKDTTFSDVSGTISLSENALTVVNKGAEFFKIVSGTNLILAGQKSTTDESTLKPVPGLSSIGGLDEVMMELQELASLALGNTPIVSGLRVTRGILLFGVSGTGKTLLANALARDSKASVFTVNGAEVYSKFFGETESRLRGIFQEMKQKAPSVIVLDELDSLCPKRSSSSSEQERRVAATLATLLDGLHESGAGSVLVLATSSRPDTLDPALRRPGRIDREVEICIPSPAARIDILKKLLLEVSFQLNIEDISEIARVAHGFVGADLAALCSRAKLHAARSGGSLTLADFNWALTQVKPSAMREVMVQVPNVKWSDIGGQKELKLKLQQAVEWPLTHPQAFSRMGISPPRGVLMFGPPGCSKTMVAKALATESGLNFLAIKGPELFSKWVGESERAVREVFRRARQVAPAVVFFDELDALGGERGGGGGNNVQERVLAQLLTELDGVEPLGNVTVLAATNRPDRIDKALLRPGRLDRIVYVPLPDECTRREIFALQLRKMPVADDVQVEELVAETEGYSGAEVLAVCHEAALKALEQNLSASQVARSHFLAALVLVTPRTPPSLLQLYEDYLKS